MTNDTKETNFYDLNEIKKREALYQLIIGQLMYDGHTALANNLASATQSECPCAPSDRLYNLFLIGQKHESNKSEGSGQNTARSTQESLVGPGLDLEFEAEGCESTPEPAYYGTAYVTSHKGPCRAGAFTQDGQLVATGSTDASIKVLDVERMLAKCSLDMSEININDHSHPVIRTIYDHADEITCLEFHPSASLLASGSRDTYVKFFDYSKPAVKRAYHVITDVECIKCMSFHPTGDYLVVGTNHPVIRIYDVQTAQCYIGAIATNHHTAPITSLKYSPNGKYFASASKDGSFKLWDGVSNKCVNTFSAAHGNTEICSIMFSKNGKYILSSGKDSKVKLWELSMSRCLIEYTGAGATGKQEHRAQATFNHTEDYVMLPDEASISLCVWNARNASRQRLLALGHNGGVRMIVHSPIAPAFLSCSEDYRARFWHRKFYRG